jgi:signal transduction histidine kinase
MLCSPVLALPRDESLTALHHKSWGETEGLTGSVLALAQTTDGYLWLGTTNGLFRFDGLYFEPFKPEGGALPATSVTTLLAVPDGGLWVGYSSGGASFLKEGKATNYSDRDGFPVGRVRSFARDWDGMIWAGAVGGFARLEGSQWQKIRMEWNYDSKSAWALFVDREGTLWGGTGKGVMFLPRGAKTFHDTRLETGPVIAFAQAPDGTIWFHNDAQPFRVQVLRPATDSRTDPLPQTELAARSILFDRDGAVWCAGIGLRRVPFPERFSGKLIRDSAPDSEKFTHDDDLTGDTAYAVLEDREGNIWVGTRSGLDRFRYRNLSWFGLPADNSRFSLVAGDNGEVWVGQNGEYYEPIIRPDHKPIKGSPDVKVHMMYRAPDGAIWVGARDKLVRWYEGKFSEIPPPEKMAKLASSSTTNDPIIVSAITEDAFGTVWAGIGGGGVFQFKDGVWTFTVALKDHPDWTPNAAFTDGMDRVWLSYGDRVAVVDHGAVRTFSAADGLTVGPFAVVAGGEGLVLVGGESGAAFLQGDRFHALKAADGNNFGSISGIVARAHDGIWLSAASGIIHVPESEMQRARQEPDYGVSYEVFDLISDLREPLQKAGASYSSTAVQATDGLLWFATRSGVVRIDPAHILRNPVPPPVVIRSVVADEKSYSTFAPPTLPPLTKSLRIGYTALSLMLPERVRFRYKLDGWDNAWQDAGTRREVFYTNLGPGSYVFHVIACNNDGVWNETGATIAFTVTPAWYQTYWFMALCVLSGCFVVWAMYRLRVRQVARAISARFDERLAERTRLAQELHDTFLQTVQGSKMVADDALEVSSDPDRMRRALEQLAIWLGQATLEGRAALNSLRNSTTEQNDLAEAFRRAMQNGRVPNSMAADFLVVGETRDMHPIVRDEIYRIVYEAIRNAYVHSRGGRLEVELKYAQDLSVRVCDNGIGIDPDVSDKGKTGHFGIQGMRERAARIGAKLTFISSPASGTEITLVVPGKIIFRNPPRTRFAVFKNVLRKLRVRR